MALVNLSPEAYFRQVAIQASELIHVISRGGNFAVKHAVVLTRVTELYRLVAEFSQVRREDRLDHAEESQEMSWINRQDWHKLVRAVAAIHTRLDAIETKQETMMANQAQVKTMVDALASGVAEETTAIGGVEVVLTNLNKKITDLLAAAENVEVDPSIVAGLEALQAATGGNKQRLLDDIKANTQP